MQLPYIATSECPRKPDGRRIVSTALSSQKNPTVFKSTASLCLAVTNLTASGIQNWALVPTVHITKEHLLPT